MSGEVLSSEVMSGEVLSSEVLSWTCYVNLIFLALTLFVQYLVPIHWAVMLYYVILNTMENWHMSDWHWHMCQRTPIWCVYILCILHPTCTLHPILPCFIVANFRKIPLALLKICLFLYLQSIKDIDPCDPDNDQM